MARFFESFDMKEAEAISGFDPKGIFASHMLIIGYPVVFNRVQEISGRG
jgi:hypothetical protein